MLQARLNLSARQRKQISQQQVADWMGVHLKTVQAWEKSSKLPDLRTVERLAAVLGSTAAWLAFGEGEQAAPAAPQRRGLTGVLTPITPDQVRPGSAAKKRGA